MKKERIVTRRWGDRRKGKTDWARFDAMTDEDIAKAVASDPDAAPIDIDWSDASGTHVDQVSGGTDQSKINSLSSVTGRVGYAWDRLLTYAKGGGAWTHDKYEIFDSTTFLTASETRSGWTVGGGFEYAIISNLSMFFEYNFYDFGTRTVGFTGSPQLVDIRERESVVKVGANWKFGW